MPISPGPSLKFRESVWCLLHEAKSWKFSTPPSSAFTGRVSAHAAGGICMHEGAGDNACTAGDHYIVIMQQLVWSALRYCIFCRVYKRICACLSIKTLEAPLGLKRNVNPTDGWLVPAWMLWSSWMACRVQECWLHAYRGDHFMKGRVSQSRFYIERGFATSVVQFTHA